MRERKGTAQKSQSIYNVIIIITTQNPKSQTHQPKRIKKRTIQKLQNSQTSPENIDYLVTSQCNDVVNTSPPWVQRPPTDP